jgi:uncharacterized protein (TIGR02145 family)
MAKYSLAHLIGCSFETITNLKYHNMMLRILPFLLLPLLGMGQTNSKVEMPMGENTTSEKQALEIKRNAFYNLEELKVRWKKAALENCPGVPCVTVTVPGSPTIVNVVAGNAQATVSFTAPSSAGGSAITSYTVTSTPAVGPGTWTGAGPSITATGLTNGTPYTFTVVATNAVGNSLPSAASSAVTPVAACSAGAASYTATLTVGTVLTPNITHATTSATGIGTATGLPAGVNAAWSGGVITISGTPSVTGTFNYTIPLTGTSCSSVNATGTITVSTPFLCGTSTVPDMDGNSYNTVLIGLQCWTQTNLKVTMYNDGTAIPLNNTYTSGSVSTVWQGLRTGAYTIYGNESSSGANATNYGFLYNWYAAVGIVTLGGAPTKNICPTGWHVPTNSDWNILVKSMHSGADTSSTGPSATQSSTAGGYMKSTGNTLLSTGLWTSPNTGADNSSFFTALPGGSRDNDGSFRDIRDNAHLWVATHYGILSGNGAYIRILYYYNSTVQKDTNNKWFGASVRCLRD